MEDQANKLTRRTALKAGASLMGTWMAMKAGAPVAWAQPSSASNSPTSSSGMAVNASQDAEQWRAVEAALGGTKGQLKPGGVFRIDLPRTDFGATIFGVPVKPDIGIDTEITFVDHGNGVAMKYELALLESEINPVLSSLLVQGLKPATEILAGLHNHYLEISPNVMYLHGFAVGKAVPLAQALYAALSSNSKTPFGHGDEPPGQPGFDAQAVTRIIGGDGELTNGVLSVSVPRYETIQEQGITLPPEMQFESVFNFQSIGGNQVAMAGEFVLLADEVDTVARVLLQQDIMITALHNHELNVKPNLYYLHCWATGPSAELARRVHVALNHVG